MHSFCCVATVSNVYEKQNKQTKISMELSDLQVIPTVLLAG